MNYSVVILFIDKNNALFYIFSLKNMLFNPYSEKVNEI